VAGRTGIGGRSRRGSGLLEALIDARLAEPPAPRPKTWRTLLASTVVCDEVTPQLAQDLDDTLLYDWPNTDAPTT